MVGLRGGQILKGVDGRTNHQVNVVTGRQRDELQLARSATHRRGSV